MADAARHERVMDLFKHACELEREARAAFLRRECSGDERLAQEVEQLLRHDDEADGFLEDAIEPTEPETDPADQVVRIGAYRVRGLLGRGGMGLVYRAEQTTPSREVAVKLINPAILGDAAARRLAEEAEFLGRLQHPGIAQVYEAGAASVEHADGRTAEQPFIAMELVRGEPLCAGAERRGLSIGERLMLLARVCDAVQHAHQRGVLHLDLKPANILVNEDGDPRVLDFGVAQAVNPRERAGERAGASSVAGTLAYMPPEQLLGQLSELDTRADIYALGAMACELLTGAPPERPRTRCPQQTALALMADPLPDLRRADGRVDAQTAAVVHKALDVNKERRYGSAGELAADLRRCVSREPVAALTPTLGRSARLFARRHRFTVAAGVGAVLVAAGGVAVLVTGLVRAHSSAKAASVANAKAADKAAKAERTVQFLQSTILGADPEERGEHVSLFDALDYAASRVHRDLSDAPEVESDVRFSLGFVYRRHGMYAKARDQVRAALHIREHLLGPNDPKTLDALEELGYLAYLRAGDLDAARMLLTRALDGHRAAGRSASEDVAWLLLKLGLVSLAADDLRDAGALFTEAEPLLAEHYGPAFASRAMRHRALTALHAGDPDDAERLARQALARCENVNEQEYIAARCGLVLARVLVEAGRYGEADAAIARAREILDARLPRDHVEQADALAIVADIALATKRPDEAAALARACLDMRTRLLEPGHPALIEARALLVRAATAPSDRRAAMDAFHALFLEAEQQLGGDHRTSLDLLRAVIREARACRDEHAVRTHAPVLARLERRRAERLSAPAG